MSDSCSAQVMKEYKDALEALGVTGEDMRGFSQAYQDTMRAKGLADAFDRVSKVVREKRMQAAIEKRTAAYNAIERMNLINHLDTVWADNRAEGIKALVADSADVKRQGSTDSAMNRANALGVRAGNRLANKLRDAGVGDLNKMIHADPKLEEQMVVAMDKLRRGESTDGLGKTAVDAARVLNQMDDEARAAVIARGGVIGDYEGYTFSQSYEPDTVRQAGYAQFAADIMANLDEERTFAEFYHLKDMHPERYAERVDKFLATTHRSIVTGLHLANAAGEPAIVPNALKGSEMWKHSHSKVLHWKGPEEALKVQRKYGRGTVFDAVMHTVESRWRSVGIMEKLGPSAKQNLLSVIEDQKHKLDPKDTDANDAMVAAEKEAIRLLGIVDGSTNAPANGMLAKAIQLLRILNTFRLGGASVASFFGDPVVAALDMTQAGNPFFRSLLEAFGSRFSGLTAADRGRLAEALSFELESGAASPWMRSDSERRHPGRMSQAAATFMRATGLPFISDKSASGHADGLARLLASYSDNPFDHLPKEMQRDLLSANIDAQHWDVYRQHGIDSFTRESGEKYNLMTPDSVDNAPQSAMEALAASELKSISDRLSEKLDKYAARAEKIQQAIDNRIAKLTDQIAAINEKKWTAQEKKLRSAELELEREILAKARTEHDALKASQILLAVEDGADVERQRIRRTSLNENTGRAQYTVEEIGAGAMSDKLLYKLSQRERNDARRLGAKLERARAEVRQLDREANTKAKKTAKETGTTAGKQTIRMAGVEDAIRKAYEQSQLEAKHVLDRARWEAQDRLRGYYQRHVAGAMSKPHARAVSFMRGGTEAGSAAREATSAFWQFKTFGMNTLYRQILPAAKSGEWANLTKFILTSTAAGAMIVWSKQLLAGRTPAVPKTKKEFAQFGMQALASGGGLAYIGDLSQAVLTWEKGYSAERLMGPTMQNVSTAFATASDLISGNVKGAEQKATQFLLDMFPNTWYTKAAWEYGVARHVREAVNPDWQKRYEKMRQQHGGGTPMFGGN